MFRIRLICVLVALSLYSTVYAQSNATNTAQAFNYSDPIFVTAINTYLITILAVIVALLAIVSPVLGYVLASRNYEKRLSEIEGKIIADISPSIKHDVVQGASRRFDDYLDLLAVIERLRVELETRIRRRSGENPDIGSASSNFLSKLHDIAGSGQREGKVYQGIAVVRNFVNFHVDVVPLHELENFFALLSEYEIHEDKKISKEISKLEVELNVMRQGSV